MGSFTIAYVPTVEEVLKVEQVDRVQLVDTVDTVNTVNDVKKLPHPYFPLKKLNYQTGGQIHVAPVTGMYQAVYIPNREIEFKGIHLCLTSYNIEDTYDVMIGSRYVIKNSYVKEMTEYRMFEVYEIVPAGTPIVINFHNNSGLEKYLMYEIIALSNEAITTDINNLNWAFYWEGLNVEVGEDDYLSLVLIQPNYVNMDSNIDAFTLTIADLTQHVETAEITYLNGTITSTYEETVPEYMNSGFLARVNVIAITSIIVYEKSFVIVFKNISSTDPHPVEIGISGSVINIR